MILVIKLAGLEKRWILQRDGVYSIGFVSKCRTPLVLEGKLSCITELFIFLLWYRVSRCHGHMVVRPRLIFLTLRKNLRCVCTNLTFMHCNHLYSFFLSSFTHIMCFFCVWFFHFFLHNILHLKFWPHKKIYNYSVCFGSF